MFGGGCEGICLSQALLKFPEVSLHAQHPAKNLALSRCPRSVCWWDEWWISYLFPSPASDDFSFSSQHSHEPHYTLEPISRPYLDLWKDLFPFLFSEQNGVSIKIIYCIVGTWYTLAVTIIKMSDMLVHTKILIVNRQWAGLSFFILSVYCSNKHVIFLFIKNKYWFFEKV